MSELNQNQSPRNNARAPRHYKAGYSHLRRTGTPIAVLELLQPLLEGWVRIQAALALGTTPFHEVVRRDLGRWGRVLGGRLCGAGVWLGLPDKGCMIEKGTYRIEDKTFRTF
eukprot:1319628-Amorphochlora_amoeboformis.AAC.1